MGSSVIGMVPTQKADGLVEPIRQALSLIGNTLDDSADFNPDESARTFNLAIGDFGEIVLLPALLARLQAYRGDLRVRSYPEVDATTYDLVKQGQLDFYFDYRRPRDDQLSSWSEADIVQAEDTLHDDARAACTDVGKSLYGVSYHLNDKTGYPSFEATCSSCVEKTQCGEPGQWC